MLGSASVRGGDWIIRYKNWFSLKKNMTSFAIGERNPVSRAIAQVLFMSKLFYESVYFFMGKNVNQLHSSSDAPSDL